jgi:hypothetical protein
MLHCQAHLQLTPFFAQIQKMQTSLPVLNCLYEKIKGWTMKLSYIQTVLKLTYI